MPHNQKHPSDLLPNLAQMSDEKLLLLRASLRAEMRKRGIADSVGAVGERLAIEHFRKTPGLPKLSPALNNTKNVDANSNRGERYSIKTQCVTSKAKKTGTVYPDKQDRDKPLFEYLLIVRLADDWSLESIHQLSWADFEKLRSWDTCMNAWYVGISSRVLSVAKLVYQVAKKKG
jgi:hypothetical protein